MLYSLLYHVSASQNVSQKCGIHYIAKRKVWNILKDTWGCYIKDPMYWSFYNRWNMLLATRDALVINGSSRTSISSSLRIRPPHKARNRSARPAHKKQWLLNTCGTGKLPVTSCEWDIITKQKKTTSSRVNHFVTNQNFTQYYKENLSNVPYICIVWSHPKNDPWSLQRKGLGQEDRTHPRQF